MEQTMNDRQITAKAELLAPAGSFESFRAALNAGADAVYLGGNMFGARAFAGNFDREELIAAIRRAHLFGRKIYLTVNTLLRDEETDMLADYIRPYYEEGLDAVIVQDYGVFAILRDNFPGLSLHASTQMTITGRYGASLLKEMGASRVVTARELSAEEIRDIHENVDVEIESFVHGALCYSYSGQCLLSSMIGGRSGNRGRCAQPCRLIYSCNGHKDRHLLSPKDMCTVESIPDILEAGVYSMKIEGRMKSPEYVAGVVSTYRRYLDMYLEKGREGFKVNPDDINKLMDIYNRGGFCKGYYYVHNEKEMMTFDRPNHQGIPVGVVNNGAIRLKEPVSAGDVLELEPGIEFTTGASKPAGATLAIPGNTGANYQAGGKQKESIRRYRPENGKPVYRTRNNALLSDIRSEYIERDVKLRCAMHAVFCVGREAVLTISCMREGREYSVTVSGSVIQASDNCPANERDVTGRLLKLGETCFCCEERDVSVELSGQPFIPVKLVNELRRAAADKLEKNLIEAAGPCRDMLYAPVTCNNRETKDSYPEDGRVRLTVQVMKKEQLEAAVSEYADMICRIYICTELEGIEGALAMCSMVPDGVEKYLVMPYIFREKTARLYERNWELICSAGFDGMLVRSPEEIQFLKDRNVRIAADYNVYTYNTAAFGEYERLGIYEYTLSEEMNAGQLKSLCRRVGNSRISMEKIVYGHLPLMITAGCTLKYTSKHSPCGRPGVYYISDRMKKRLPVINSCMYCYNMIYNYIPENLMDKKEELVNMGVQSLRVVFSVESGEETRKVLDRWNKNRDGGDFTRGHYNRGVD